MPFIIRMSAIRKLAAEAADNGLLARELAAGIARVKSVKSTGIRVGKLALASAGPGPPQRARRYDGEGTARPSDTGCSPRLRPATIRGGGTHVCPHPATRWPLVHRGSEGEAWPCPYHADASVG